MSDDDYPPGSLGAETQRLAAELRALGQDATADAMQEHFRQLHHVALVRSLRASGNDDLADIVEANP